MLKQIMDRDNQRESAPWGWFQDLCGMAAGILSAMFMLAMLYGLNTGDPWPAVLTFALTFAMWIFTGFARRIG